MARPLPLNSFIMKRLFSIAGLLPIGGFLIAHLYTNSQVVHGREAFNAHVAFIHAFPLLLLAEIFLIWLPILFHGAVGLYIYFGKAEKPAGNVDRYRGVQNWQYLAQRISGVFLFVFIAYHVLWMRFIANPGKAMEPEYQGKGGDYYQLIVEHLSHPFIAFIYFLGVSMAAFHLANGMWNFCITWGITTTQRSQRYSAGAFALIGIGVFLLGMIPIVHSLGAVTL